MSFSANVKAEMCRAPRARACCVRAEAYGALLYASTFGHKEIRLLTALPPVARRLQELLSRAFDVRVCLQQSGHKTLLEIKDQPSLARIFDALGYDLKSHVVYHCNRNVIENDCCAAAFLRGVFFMAGTVAGPEKKSHLEMKSAHQSLCGEVMSLMLDLRLSPKQTKRAGAHVLYFKDGGSVEDFLTLLGAPHAALELMEAKVEKNLRNTINRQVNCETANFVKAADASARQIAAIQAYLQRHGQAAFPESLRETVRLRVQNPTDSLSELAARFAPPITKSGLSHRLKKITQLATREED